MSPVFELLEPRLQMARPDPSAAENVKFRLPLATDTTTHYYFDRDDTAGDTAWNGTSQTYDGHHGTDFSGGPRGKAVYAAADGILIAKVDGLPDGNIDTPGNGNYVRLNHGNDRTGKPINSVYLHFNAGSVTTKPIGSLIKAGELIGGVGTSGHSTGLHLHMETQLARVAFDPFKANGSAETSWWVNQGSGSPSTTVNTPKLVPGDAVQVYDLPASTLNVRGPAAAGSSIGGQPNGATGTVLEGPTYAGISGDIDNNLWVWYRVQWANGLTGWSTQNWMRKVVDATAPVVQSASFLFETAPHKLDIGFSENVFASIGGNDLPVTRVGVPLPIANTLTYNTSTNVATLNFNSVLPEGDYQLHVSPGTVADAAGNTNTAAYHYNFHVLAGDANRDHVVNFPDLVILSQNYGKTGQTFSQGNFNYSPSGTVDFADLVLLAQRYDANATGTTPELATAVEKKRRDPVAKSIL